MPVELVIGAGNWGQTERGGEKELVAAIRKYKSVIKNVDTAVLYPLYAPGVSEAFVGEAEFGRDGFVVNTKILSNPDGGCYTHEGVGDSCSKSLQSLKMEKVNVLYAHAPDRKTPIREQAAAFNQEYAKGDFNCLGVANLDAVMLLDWISAAEKMDYNKPTIYQGMIAYG